MKLSELVAYKNMLDVLSAKPVQREVELELGKITHLVETQGIQLGNFKQQIFEQCNAIHAEIDKFENQINLLKQELKTQIEIFEKSWFLESYRLYEEEMYYETPDYILSRQSHIDAETELVMRSRLQNYSSWQHPGMIVRPGLEKFIDDMVSFDPLYIVDQHYDLLKPAMNQYPEEYQKRLRTYVVTERIDRDMLDKIPNNQFGICFVYNYFNFRPFEFIKKYIEEIYQKLKPGGVLIMTFNDCDRAKAVMLVEQHYACYTPGSLLQNLAHRIGFETIFTWNNGGPTTWLELRKPGTLTSLRGGQTLAKIVHKSVAESK
jgi:hypothetical protein